jgi:hypothetical protein
VSDEIRQIQPQDTEIQEEWIRETDDPEIRDVSACRIDEIGGWLVFVSALEFVREDPLESELRQRIAAALRGVAGVTSADEHDREQWFVAGAPSGKSLIEAVALVVDDLAERAHAEVLGW